jgi:hypothetical protein
MASLALGGLGYARFEAGWIHVTRQIVPVPRLPAPFSGKTIALLSDPHHGPFNSLELLCEAVDRTNALNPDLVALAGDFIDGQDAHLYIRPALEMFGRLRAPLGVYAVPGNHDYYENAIHAVHQAIRDNGIFDVSNAGRWIELEGTRLRIAGVDDLWHGKQDLASALGDMTPTDTSLLLCHNPDYVEKLTDRRVGLVLSGHLHGGQIVLPGVGYQRIPSQYGLKYLQGLVQAPHTQVFVSRGLGTVGVPLRFRCRPEINLLTLMPGEHAT